MSRTHHSGRPTASRATRDWTTAALSATALLLCLPLSACFEEETVALSYLGVNHTDQWVSSFLINGEGGVINVSPQGGGGKTACCVVLPRRWRPNLKVTIKWQGGGKWLTDANGKEVLRDGQQVLVEDPWIERTETVPEYTEKDLAHFDVHFLPDDQVRVKVSFYYPEHADYRPAYPTQRSSQP
ncbi:DUF3304 domain-containing protein [Aquabacterium parvum]|jgi:hypothetical protein|uniref:DUF3304 domain-containing protein n=1 Tax=Aquabacterium parvum TaxID=70584 RepID=UPI0009F9784E|nr:DUF3304 domain-containing protein [Aquabacterium parvum]MBU0918213.1 DUF3304 domain-containing protein [Gammaproteobacteria bacterium]